MAKAPSRVIEAAVRATRLYLGSTSCRMRDQQRLYERMNRLIDGLAERTGMEPSGVRFQIGTEANRRGPIAPIPGKDY